MPDLLPVEVVPLDSLTPHPRNYRAHPEAQLIHLESSLRENGWNRNVIIARDGTILAGHGIVTAARRIGLDEAPAVRVDVAPDDPRALKILASDNELSRQAQNDDAALLALLEEIRDESGLIGTGFDETLFASFAEATRREQEAWDEMDEERESKYTSRADTPLYAPLGETPDLAELTEQTRYRTLLEGLAQHPDLPGEVYEFLTLAATRHIRFHYGKIAEYYAAAAPEVQRLMEDSALIIIDLERAIELGYARMRDRMIALREETRAADGA
jgi:hypothetical protein